MLNIRWQARAAPGRLVALLALAGAAFGAAAQSRPSPYDQGMPKPQGFLCCNMRSNGAEMSDINYFDRKERIVAAGTPVQVVEYGRYRVMLRIDGKVQALRNDFSREIEMRDFVARYVLAEDPRLRLATYPEPVRSAIQAGHLRRGMNREQVVMAMGHPSADSNPRLDGWPWRYWMGSFDEYVVMWNDADLVKNVVADAPLRSLVFEE